MILSWLLCLLISIQAEIPFKPKEEFDVKLNYSFKQRSSDDHNTFRYDVQERNHSNQNSSTMLPYLVLKVKILKAASTEVKLKVVNNLSSKVISKKIHEGVEFEIDMGYTDDVKDHVTAHEYIIFMQNEKQERQSKIVIFVDEDGVFLINDEIRGKL
jgi:hypothetical protein